MCVSFFFFFFLTSYGRLLECNTTSNVNRIDGKSNEDEDTYSGLLIVLRDYDDNDEDEAMKFIQPLCQPSMGLCVQSIVFFFSSLHFYFIFILFFP